MNEFKNFHPIINFLYFTAVIVLGMFLLHPICLAISLLSSFAYAILLNEKKAIKMQLSLLLPMVLGAALLNPAFNHQGITILTYLPSGNPLTLESIVYGIAAALMLVTVISWFSCYNKIMTSDKFVYLFGRMIPSLSLVLSMTLRFVPRFTAQFHQVANAQKCIGRDASYGGLFKRMKNALTILSIMITWALENAVETADSMKSRGYGLPGRSAFSIYVFDTRDKHTLICLLGLLGYVLLGIFTNQIDFRFFPSMEAATINPYSITIFVAYFLLCSMPVWIEIREAKQWTTINSNL